MSSCYTYLNVTRPVPEQLLGTQIPHEILSRERDLQSQSNLNVN